MATTTSEGAAVGRDRSCDRRASAQLCYFGAAPDTSNLGVSALCYAVVGSIARLVTDAQITVFDHGRGVRADTQIFNGQPFEYDRCGACQTRRIWRRESFWNIAASAWLGGLGSEQVRRLRAADTVLDISGGDSFTDLYGPRRFASVAASKRLALQLSRPLILLPQTYGPYRDPAVRAEASEIVRRAVMCWARDARSYETLKELLGPNFDPERHRCGVDVAFALEPRPPRVSLPEPIATWLSARRERDGDSGTWKSADQSRPLVGFNVSGLIWHDPAAMRERYGFKADYRVVVLDFLRYLLRETDADILLVPHVVTLSGHYESDPGANEAVLSALREDASPAVRGAAAQRIACSPATLDHPSEAKWIISHCDWFCGTRMHACIAGLSSGVPTAAIAYSLKTQGVFETCGQGDSVVDPRALDTLDVVSALIPAFERRAASGGAIRGRVGELQHTACEQIRCCLEVSDKATPQRGGAR